MSEAKLPHIVRPVVIKDDLSAFLSDMMMLDLDFDPLEEPSLQLVTSQELQFIPPATKKKRIS